MDLGDLGKVLTAFAAGAGTEYLRHWLNQRASAKSAAQARQRAVLEAYAEAVRTLTFMMDAFPAHQTQKAQLRELFRTRALLFASEDASHVWVALSDSATLSDLSRVRDLLRHSGDRIGA